MTRAAVWSLLGALAGVAVAGCGDVQSTGSGVALLPEAARQAMLTTSHFVPVAGKRDGRLSYMAPGAKRKSALMYVGDWATNDVFVYDYRSGSSVGTLRGFDAPYGMCVEQEG